MDINEVEFLPKEFTNFEIYPTFTTTPFYVYTQNDKKTLIVYIKNTEKEDEMLVFLAKIFRAIKYELESDVILVGIDANQQHTFSALFKGNEVEKVVCFGVKSQQLSIAANIPSYVLTALGNYQFLLADKLEILIKNNAKKRQLWSCLQNMFL